MSGKCVIDLSEIGKIFGDSLEKNGLDMVTYCILLDMYINYSNF